MSDETFATKDVTMTTVSLETRPVLAQAENVPKPKHDDSNLFDDTKTPQAVHMIDLEQISRGGTGIGHQMEACIGQLWKLEDVRTTSPRCLD
jgi:hypothetical protein